VLLVRVLLGLLALPVRVLLGLLALPVRVRVLLGRRFCKTQRSLRR
jgi:hypothetical protein